MNQSIDILEKHLSRLERKMDANDHRVNEKIDSLLKFKWQVVGGTTAISVIITVCFQVIQTFLRG